MRKGDYVKKLTSNVSLSKKIEKKKEKAEKEEKYMNDYRNSTTSFHSQYRHSCSKDDHKFL